MTIAGVVDEGLRQGPPGSLALSAEQGVRAPTEAGSRRVVGVIARSGLRIVLGGVVAELVVPGSAREEVRDCVRCRPRGGNSWRVLPDSRR